uniref:SurA N-terminal domain-containing protein n=1 Tax=Candidatus Planktophila sp. TaxID=2175601 RepID=UPI00404948E0
MKKVFVVAVAALAVVLSGCAQVGAAATVGGTRISQATVQGSVDAILAERVGTDTSQMQLETGETLNRSQLRFHLFGTLLREVGAELKITVTKAEIDTQRAAILQQVGGEDQLPFALVSAGIAAQDLDLYIEAITFSDKISNLIAASGVPEEQIGSEIQRLITAKAKELGVTVNPRYGTWDSEIADVVAKDAAGSAVTPSGN